MINGGSREQLSLLYTMIVTVKAPKYKEYMSKIQILSTKIMRTKKRYRALRKTRKLESQRITRRCVV